MRMPLRYGDQLQELQTSRLAAMTDRSFIGKLRITGKDRESLLHRLSTNEIRGMKPGESRITVFPNAKGRIVDAVELLAFDDHYLMLTGPGRDEIMRGWIEKYCFIEDVQISDVSTALAVIVLLGNEIWPAVQRSLSVAELSIGAFVNCEWQGVKFMLHRPAGLSAAAVQMIVPEDMAVDLWQALLAVTPPVGMMAYESRRIANGVPAADHELIEQFNPHEVGLFPYINFNKGCYIGQEVIARLDSYDKVQRKLVVLAFEEHLGVAEGAALFFDDKDVGTLTSLAASLAGAIGLGVVRTQFAQSEARLEARWPDGSAACKVITSSI